MIKTEKINSSEFKVVVPLESVEWAKTQAKAFVHLRNNLKLPGFRKGQIPERMAREKISQNEIWKEGVNQILQETERKARASLNKDIQVIAMPSYNVDKVTSNELEIGFVYTTYPQFEIPNYNVLKSQYKVDKVAKDVVDTELKSFQARLTLWNLVEKPLAEGMKVKMNFQGFVDKKPFEGGKAENYELVIGSNKFIPGFEKQMVGMRTGEKKSIKVKFPAKYHDPQFANKDATFNVEVLTTHEKSVPAINDQLAADANIPGVKTLTELKKYILHHKEQQQIALARGKFFRDVVQEIAKLTNLEVPNTLLVRESNRIRQGFDQFLKQQKTDAKDYFKANKITPEQMLQRFRAQAADQILQALVTSKILQKEKISVTPDELSEGYKKIAKVYNRAVVEIQKNITEEQVRHQLITDKVVSFLINKSKKAGVKT